MSASLSLVSVPMSVLLDSLRLSVLILAFFPLCWLAGLVGADVFDGEVGWGELVVKQKRPNESGEAAPH